MKHTTWERRLIAEIRAMHGEGETYAAFSERLGLNLTALYKIMQGERGIGADTLERLRLAQPELVAEVFCPEDYALVARDGGGASRAGQGIFLPDDVPVGTTG